MAFPARKSLLPGRIFFDPCRKGDFPRRIMALPERGRLPQRDCGKERGRPRLLILTQKGPGVAPIPGELP